MQWGILIGKVEKLKDDKMNKYYYVPPLIVRKLVRNVIWESSVNKVLLTFDDSPNPETTEKILKFLNSNNIKACFFCVGKNVIKYPDLLSDIISEGHTIGSHTYDHFILTRLAKDDIKLQLDLNSSLIEEKCGVKPKFFRPPYGRFLSMPLMKYISEKHLKLVMWTLLTYDFTSDFDVVKKTIKRYTRSNSILVFHDNSKTNGIIIDSLKYAIDHINNKNFIIGDPTECLK